MKFIKKPNIKLSTKALTGTLAVLVVITAAASVMFILWPSYRTHSSQVTLIKSYAYIYKNLENYKVPGFKPGAGMSFDKPTEFKSTLPSSNAPIADLAHIQTSKNNLVAVLGNIVASGLPPSSGKTQLSAAALKTALSNPSGSQYQAAVKPMQQLVTQKLSDINIKFSAAQSLSTPNISDNAWKMDFTSSPKSGNNAAAFPLKQGTVVMAAGKNSTYYLMMDALNDNWQANQQVWTNIINSLKVDQ